jgi:1-acylglycerone phosphate reductase
MISLSAAVRSGETHMLQKIHLMFLKFILQSFIFLYFLRRLMPSKKMSSTPRTVLVTGCSDGGMGAALAMAFHEAGHKVYATARNPSKMKELASHGIKTLTLDIESEESIKACVSQVPNLDVLLNNAGVMYSMPISDLSITEAKKVFDVNVWAYIAVTQAFLPHLLKSKGMIVNQTSVLAGATVPFQSAYNASKAALAMFTDTLRLELEPFGVTVVDMRTGAVASNMIQNQKENTPTTLPAGSIYEPARDVVESAMRKDKMVDAGVPALPWAREIVQDLMARKPPIAIWRGGNARMARMGAFMPHSMLDSVMKKHTGLDIVETKVRK